MTHQYFTLCLQQVAKKTRKRVVEKTTSRGGLFAGKVRKKKKENKEKSQIEVPTAANDDPVTKEKDEQPSATEEVAKDEKASSKDEATSPDADGNEDESYSTADEEDVVAEAPSKQLLPSESQAESEAWKKEQLEDLGRGNRLGAQRRTQRLIGDYFRNDPETGELIYLDDGTSRVRGSDIRRILNFLVPLKNIHPKAKPNGFAPVIEILRIRKLTSTGLFPNESVDKLIQEYGMKPTAHKKRIVDLEEQRIQIKQIAEGLKLSYHEKEGEGDHETAKAVGSKDWQALN